MAGGVNMQVMDTRGLILAFKQLDKRIDKDCSKALQSAGAHIVADAQRNLRNGGLDGKPINTTGRLSNSGKTQVLKNGDVEAGFFTSDTEGTGYAAAVEYGRKAGKWPPLFQMAAWARKKLRVEEKRVNSVAFFLARKIGEKGTRPHPFFEPALSKNKDRIQEAVAKTIKTIIR